MEPCHCPDNRTIQWRENLPFCLDERGEPQCTEQWQCSDVSLNYNFVNCVDGACICRGDQVET